MFLSVKKQVVTSLIGRLNQFAILEFVPADSPEVGDLMLQKATRNGLWSSVFEKNLHP